MYSHVLVTADRRSPTAIDTIAREAKNADVLFVGEYHGHQGAHLFQLLLLEQLYKEKKNLVLSMEQFSRDRQSEVDSYLEGKYGEKTFIQQANAWDNYESAYRPLVEFAKEHNLPVVAANAPPDIVRCVARLGPEVLDDLPADKRAWVNAKTHLESQDYREKFSAVISSAEGAHGTEDKAGTRQLENHFAAQLLRDTTMAQSIVQALEQFPGVTVVHLNGAFHSDFRLGTVQALERLNPGLNAVVVSPLMVDNPANPAVLAEDWQRGDYLLLLRPLPESYLDKDREREAMATLFKKRDSEPDACNFTDG